jgi:transposase
MEALSKKRVTTLGEEDLGKAVGIDVGIKHFLTDTDGRQIENQGSMGKHLKG